MKKTAAASKAKSKVKEKSFIRHANVDDAEVIQALVLHYAKKNDMLPRSLNDIYENIRDYIVIEENKKITACCALHVCWRDLAEVRSLAVAPRQTKKGLGSRIVKYALKEASSLGIERVFALTFRTSFFENLGFRKVEMNELPKKVWVDCIKCVHFPNCNETALVIDL